MFYNNIIMYIASQEKHLGIHKMINYATIDRFIILLGMEIR